MLHPIPGANEYTTAKHVQRRLYGIESKYIFFLCPLTMPTHGTPDNRIFLPNRFASVAHQREQARQATGEDRRLHLRLAYFFLSEIYQMQRRKGWLSPLPGNKKRKK